jgi:hypothetical protein
MEFVKFKESLARNEPPSGLSLPLQALWWDAKGDWDRAHGCAQDDSGREGAWVHAYLHRKQGDASNARYWYGQANRSAVKDAPFEAEWEDIARGLLGI